MKILPGRWQMKLQMKSRPTIHPFLQSCKAQSLKKFSIGSCVSLLPDCKDQVKAICPTFTTASFSKYSVIQGRHFVFISCVFLLVKADDCITSYENFCCQFGILIEIPEEFHKNSELLVPDCSLLSFQASTNKAKVLISVSQVIEFLLWGGPKKQDFWPKLTLCE